jgi:hypothetical protein
LFLLLSKFLQQVTLARRQMRRCRDSNDYVEVAFAPAVQARHAFAAQTQSRPALHSRRDRDLDFLSSQAGNFDFAAQSRAHEVDGPCGVEIVAFAGEALMRTHSNPDEQVAGLGRRTSRFTLTREAEDHAVVDSGRNLNVYLVRDEFQAAASTGRAR